MSRLTLILAVAGIPAALLLAGCSFDDGALGQKTSCITDEDCVSSVCVDGACLAGPDPSDVEAPDTAPDVGVDTPTCGGEPPNACGGCDGLAAEPGDPCNSGCGTYRCAPGGEAVLCDTDPLNECGGCGVLGAEPGTPCGGCGTWTCDEDSESVICLEDGTNACGGCTELGRQPGETCGECDGTYECDGADAVVCVGGDANECGGCGGDPEARVGAECACAGLGHRHPATWRCVEGSKLPLCDDDNDSALTAVDLGELGDTDTSPRVVHDALQFAGDADWFVADVTDNDDFFDPLIPEIQASDLPASHDICAIWQYDDRRAWPILCAGGSEEFLVDGTPGCCAVGTGTTRTIRILRDIAFNERLDDAFRPGEANGSLFVVVFSETDGVACEEFTLHVRF